MSGYQQDFDKDVLSEGGGSGGGSRSVKEERWKVSPLRVVGLVLTLLLSTIVIIVPVVRIAALLKAGADFEVAWIFVTIAAVTIALFVLYYLFRKNIGIYTT